MRSCQLAFPFRSLLWPTLIILPNFPPHDLQVKDRDAVEHGYEQERDERRYAESPDLCIAKRLPKGSSVTSKREQRQDGRADCDQDGTKPLDSGIANGLLKRFTRFVHLFNEIE